MITNTEKGGHSEIPYRPNEVEGECILKQIKCLQFITWKYVLFVMLCVVTIGIPLLICYWYPWMKRIFFYNFCEVNSLTHFYVVNYDDEVTIVKKQQGLIFQSNQKFQNSVFFVNRFLKYYYDVEQKWFTAVTYDSLPRVTDLVNTTKLQGYTSDQVDSLRLCYGEGAMVIPTPSCPILFVRQILQPFFIFIVYSIILWFYEAYYHYASVIAATCIFSIGINLWQIMELNKKIFDMAYYEVKVHALRSTGVVEISSVDVVPGDIVFIKDSIKLPFDGILLGGSVLMNECALTGQSVPIVKKGVDRQEFNSQKVADKNSYLFEGTQLVQVCSHSHNPAHTPYAAFGLMVCVTRTNFVTIKGQLIRIITFPKDREMKFYIESAKFVLFLFAVSILSNCILLIKLAGKVVGSQIAVKFFDLITIIVPPGLPASMSIGIAYSIKRLKKCNIFCISPDKIITGGRIDHICFDKTGTLTQIYMDFYQFVPKIGKSFVESINLQTRDQPDNVSIMSKDESLQALLNMASCHSIMNLIGTKDLIGDPMEIKLFEFGKFTLTQQSSVMNLHPSNLFSFKGQSIEGTIFRRFEFSSDMHRMSVIAASSIDPKNAYVYCKGSPESLVKIMNPEGIPDNYFEVLKKYTSCGFRVLAVCSKKIPVAEIETIDRVTAESRLEFSGFEVFENKLKPETVPSIKILRKADITIVIITGDNVLTGANIGFKSGIIESDMNIMICDLTSEKKVSVTNFYESEDVKKPVADNYEPGTNGMIELKPRKEKTETDFVCEIDELPYKAVEIGKKGDYVFCITGSLFQQIYNTENNNEIIEIKREFMNYIKVFARSKPNDKTKAISIFQTIGRTTAMCGDGANDCGALKQADAGLSLAEAEASISAPFTSKVQNISSMVSLIRECRGGLATNFSLFNIMALYSLTQYTSTVINQYYFAYPADFQTVYWDVACNFFFFLTIGYTASQDKLSKLIPSDSLFSLGNIISVLVMFILQLVCQVLSIVIASHAPFSDMIRYWQIGGQHNDYQMYLENHQFIKTSAEGTVVFMVSNFMLLFSVLAFTIDYPWKKKFYTNWLFMVVFCIIFAYSGILVMVPQARIPILNMLDFDYQYRFMGMMLGLALAFGTFMYVEQKFILQPFFRYLKNKHPEKKWL